MWPRRPRHGYRVDVSLARGETVFAVVAPSGARLYTYADARTAKAEVDALNDADGASATSSDEPRAYAASTGPYRRLSETAGDRSGRRARLR